MFTYILCRKDEQEGTGRDREGLKGIGRKGRKGKGREVQKGKGGGGRLLWGFYFILLIILLG